MREKSYAKNSSHAGYGARLWVHSDFRPMVEYKLNKLSKWQGVDKSYDSIISWEFGEEQLEQAERYLLDQGFHMAVDLDNT